MAIARHFVNFAAGLGARSELPRHHHVNNGTKSLRSTMVPTALFAAGLRSLSFLDLTPRLVRREGTTYRRKEFSAGARNGVFSNLTSTHSNLDSFFRYCREAVLRSHRRARGTRRRFFPDYEMKEGVHEAFDALIPYMDAQGLAHLAASIGSSASGNIRDADTLLVALRAVFQMNATMRTRVFRRLFKQQTLKLSSLSVTGRYVLQFAGVPTLSCISVSSRRKAR